MAELFDGLSAKAYVERELAAGFWTSAHNFNRMTYEEKARFISIGKKLFEVVFKDDPQDHTMAP